MDEYIFNRATQLLFNSGVSHMALAIGLAEHERTARGL